MIARPAHLHLSFAEFAALLELQKNSYRGQGQSLNGAGNSIDNHGADPTRAGNADRSRGASVLYYNASFYLEYFPLGAFDVHSRAENSRERERGRGEDGLDDDEETLQDQVTPRGDAVAMGDGDGVGGDNAMGD